MINPDFKSADEVQSVGPMGWIGTIDQERRAQDVLQNDMSFATKASEPEAFDPIAWKLFDEFQKSKGRSEGSFDWSLLDEWLWKADICYLPQLIGSCVMSNTLPLLPMRMTIQIALLGRAEEYLGLKEFGPNSFAPYGPWNYGMARKRANMKGGDGLYCEAMQSSLMKDGILPCNTPELLTLLKKLGVANDHDLPEPQNESVYRAFGNWNYIDDLKKYSDYILTESPVPTSVEEVLALLRVGKPIFVCSSNAIKKVGEHKDGFPIHKRDTANSWPHNMNFQGIWKASDGEEFIRHGNTSWRPKNIYNIPVSEVNTWFNQNRLSVATIGNINSPKSVPLAA